MADDGAGGCTGEAAIRDEGDAAAQTGGPIALVEEGDLIEIDIPARKLNIIGIKGERKSPEEIDAVLAQRRAAWKPKPRRYKRGTLRLFSEHAASPMKGAYLEYND